MQTTGYRANDEAGFTLVEMLAVMAVLLVVSAMVLQAAVDMVRANGSMTNRSHMHAGLRNATALLQQEVGQAGRVALPAPASLAGAVAGAGAVTVGVTSAAGMFVGQQIVVDTGADEETVTLTAVNQNANTITAEFALAHDAGSPVAARGGFFAGVIPTTMANGSSGTVLKIVGDVNGDGNMVYVEYTCDLANERLFRNSMPFDAAAKPAVTVEQVLLTNLLPNPEDADGNVPPCFTYQERTFSGMTFVISVAITTTVETELRDPITRQFQRVTNALLNVSPRNVINVWHLASLGQTNRVQPLPPSVVALLP
jgi:prepilin-type N-terminal cleavage/methylation domain-containing protein